MGITLDWDSRRTPHVQVLSCNYVKTASILHPQARFQSSTPLHYLNIAIYLCKSVTPSNVSAFYKSRECHGILFQCLSSFLHQYRRISQEGIKQWSVSAIKEFCHIFFILYYLLCLCPILVFEHIPFQNRTMGYKKPFDTAIGQIIEIEMC